MKKLIIILVILCSVNAWGYEFAKDWTWKDTAYQGVFLSLLGFDYLQTHTMAKNDWVIDGKNYHETCPILPSHPSVKEVDIYFGACALGHTLVSMALSPDWKVKILGKEYTYRRLWQSVWISIEAGYAINNIVVGVRIEL